MTDKEIRLRCIELAKETCGQYCPPSEILYVADGMYKYTLTGELPESVVNHIANIKAQTINKTINQG